MMSAWPLPYFLRISLLSIFVFAAINAQAIDESSRMIQLGDAAYSRRAFDSAINYYEQATTSKPSRAEALYKLGNAHYRLKHLGEAVLSYERALLAQPGFAAPARNVRVIQQQIEPNNSKEVFFIRWWQSITAPELSNFWALSAIIIFLALLVGLGLNQYKRIKPRWQRMQIIFGVLIVATAFIVFALAGAWRDSPKSAAVIMRSDTKFRSVSSGSGKGAGINLPEGLLVKILKGGKDEIMVELPDGQPGFVQRSDIATVE
jgi:tetratricopeptide (TPR) repeat protein